MTTKALQLRDVARDHRGLKGLLIFRRLKSTDIIAEVNDDGCLDLHNGTLDEQDVIRFIDWLKGAYGHRDILA